VAWNVSPQFGAALAASHTVNSRIDIAPAGAGQPLRSSVPFTSGVVHVSATATTWRYCEVQLVDDGTLVPLLATDDLMPYGNELALYRGIGYPVVPDGPVPLGVFRISKVEIADYSGSAGRSIKVTGYDRSRTVSRDTLTDVVTIAAGTDFAAAIQALISPALSAGQAYNFQPTSNFLGGGINTPLIVLNAGDDRWQKAQEMAAAIGGILYFDQAGICVLRPMPDPTTTAPTVTFADGAFNLLSMDRTVDDAEGFNTVVVEGQGTGAGTPVRAIAQDTDPASPTNVSGPYGTVVAPTVRTSLVTTTAQAQAMATAQLNKLLGLTELVPFTAVPYPQLDAFDVVSLLRSDSKVNANYAIEAIDLPLEPETAMTVSTRARRV
jgi:hypothetical protein